MMSTTHLFDNLESLEPSPSSEHYIRAKKTELITMFVFLVQSNDWAGVKGMIDKSMITLEDFSLKGPLNINKFSQSENCTIMELILSAPPLDSSKDLSTCMYNLSSYAGEKLYFELANTLNKFNALYPESFYSAAFYILRDNNSNMDKTKASIYFNYLISNKSFLNWALERNKILISYIKSPDNKIDENELERFEGKIGATPILNLIQSSASNQVDFDDLKEAERYHRKTPADLLDEIPYSNQYPFYLYDKASLPLEQIFYTVWAGLHTGQHKIYINLRQHLEKEEDIKEFKKQITILLKFFSGFKNIDEANSIFTYSNSFNSKEVAQAKKREIYKSVLQDLITYDCIDLKLLLQLEPGDFCKPKMNYYVTRQTDFVQLLGKEVLDKLILENNLIPVNQKQNQEPISENSKIKNKI